MLPDQDMVWFLLRHIYQKWINITSFVRKSNASQPVWRLCREQRYSLAHEYSSRLTSALSIRLQEQVGQIHRGNISERSQLCCTVYLERLVLGFLAAVCMILALAITENVPYGKRFDCSFVTANKTRRRKRNWICNLKNANGICMPKKHCLWFLLLPEIWADLSPVQSEIRIV